MIKLNLGCGRRNYGEDWIHIDGGDYPHLDAHDITKLDYEDDSVDLIMSSHVIEYFDRKEVLYLLKEWKRDLKPNGILRLAVPDFNAMTKLYLYGEYSLDSFLGPLYGKMEMDGNTIYHKTVFDFKSLKTILENIGFNNIHAYNWWETEHADIDDCSQAYLPKMDKEHGTLISLNVEAVK